MNPMMNKCHTADRISKILAKLDTFILKLMDEIGWWSFGVGWVYGTIADNDVSPLAQA